jgi:class 3 adenylate cyclase
MVGKMQELVNKLKVYELDTRAGLLICQGNKLVIKYMDSNLQKILGRPSCIADLLLVTMRDKHVAMVAAYRGKDLPESLNHPLRNVQISDKDGNIISAKIIVGKLGIHMLEQMYYVIVQPNEICGFRPPSIGLSRRLSSDSNSSWSHMIFSPGAKKLALRKYSSAPSFSFSNTFADLSPRRTPSESNAHNHADPDHAPGRAGRSPSHTPWGAAGACAERHARATVLCVDLVGYTGQCAARGLEDLGGWMERIHAAADRLLARHAIRRVETRGDSFVCLAGTGGPPPPPGVSAGEGVADGAADQATRMLAFARELQAALRDVDGTEARMGMATGPVVLARVAHAGDARPADYVYGCAAAAAARLERAGRAGAVYLDEAAARAYATEGGAATPPLCAMAGAGVEGAGLAAVFDCAAGRFVDATGGEGGGEDASAGPPQKRGPSVPASRPRRRGRGRSGRSLPSSAA